MYLVAMLSEPVLGDFAPSLIAVQRSPDGLPVKVFPVPRVRVGRNRPQEENVPGRRNGDDRQAASEDVEDGDIDARSSTSSDGGYDLDRMVGADVHIDAWMLSDDEDVCEEEPSVSGGKGAVAWALLGWETLFGVWDGPRLVLVQWEEDICSL